MSITKGTITLLNKLNKDDSVTGLDTWYKTVITNCEYSTEKNSTVVNNTVQMGQSFTVLIPFSDSYLPYNEWVKADRDKTYTLHPLDIIIMGEIEETDINPSNIIKIQNKYEPNTCKIRSITEVMQVNNVKYQFRVGGV